MLILVSFLFLTSSAVLAGERDGAKSPATITLKGKVIDKSTNESLAGALVWVEGTDMKAYTDLDGNFSIEGLMPDTYEVKCSLISYKEVEEKITLERSGEKHILSLENSSAW